MKTPMRPAPIPSVVELAGHVRDPRADARVDARVDRSHQTDRDLLVELADYVNEDREWRPKLEQLVLEHESTLRSHGKRLDNHGNRINVLEEHVGAVKATAPPVLPARPPLPSGHFDDFTDDERTSPGGRLLLTKEQLDRHQRAQFEGWMREHDEKTALAADANVTREVRLTVKKGLSKGTVGAIAAAVVAAWAAVGAVVLALIKSYVDKAVGGHH